MSNRTVIERIKIVTLTQNGEEKKDQTIGLNVSDDYNSFLADIFMDKNGNLITELPFDDIEVLAMAMRHESIIMDETMFDPECHTGLYIGDNYYDSEEMKVMKDKAESINGNRIESTKINN